MALKRAWARWSGVLQSCAVAAFAVSTPGAGTHIPAVPRTYHAFWIQGSHGPSRATCLRLAQGPRVRLFGCPGNRVALTDARAIEAAVEDRIVARDTQLFGLPQHLFPINILFVPLPSSTLGYFDENDVNPNTITGDPVHSNRANVLYVRFPDSMPDSDRLAETEEVAAHELQHLIDYRLRVIDLRLPAQQDWLNEGLSFYAQVANGYWTPRDVLKVHAAMRSPWWPVTSLRPDLAFMRHNARLAYGRAGLFTTYLAAQFGPKFIRDLVTTPRPGLEGVDAVIRHFDPHEDLSDLYSDWAVALYLDRSGRYGYAPADISLPQPSMAIPPVASYPFDSNGLGAQALWLRPWGQEYIRFTTRDNGDLRISVTGPGPHLRIAAILEDSNGVIATQVHWLAVGSGSATVFHYAGFGGFYDRVTLAITNIGSEQDSGMSKPEAVRVQATLTDSRNDSSL